MVVGKIYPVAVSEPCTIQTLWLQRMFLTLRDGILYRCWGDVPGGSKNKRLQLVLPHKMRTIKC